MGQSHNGFRFKSDFFKWQYLSCHCFAVGHELLVTTNQRWRKILATIDLVEWKIVILGKFNIKKIDPKNGHILDKEAMKLWQREYEKGWKIKI